MKDYGSIPNAAAHFHAFVVVLDILSYKYIEYVPYKMKIWHRIYFGSLVNYKNLPN